MTLSKTCALGCLSMMLAACGGSGSETPPPVEPTTPGEWEREPEPETDKTTESDADESGDENVETPDEDAPIEDEPDDGETEDTD